ncbi:basic helix-loop-helix protein [Thecaphora frezii]
MSAVEADVPPHPPLDERSEHRDRPVDESVTLSDAPERSVADDKDVTSEQETSVGNILAQLNQEQLASIVAAARASEAQRQQQARQGDDDGADHAYAHLDNLPPSLGQAASALTSFASSFKRSVNLPLERGGDGHDEAVAAGTDADGANKMDDAPPPPGTEYQAHELHRHPEHAEHADGESAQCRDEGQAMLDDADLAAARAAHDKATAAAIASLGSLAAQQSEANSHQAHAHAHSHAHSHAHHHPAHALHSPGAGLEGGSPVGTPGSATGGKRSRGPELERQRKDNHKEVERRRRSAISDGINQLSQIVPGCDAKNTNKSSIIVAAVRYIQDLKNNEASNIEKWTLEKLLMDQAMGDLSAQLDEALREVERLREVLKVNGWEEGAEVQLGEQQQGEGEGEAHQLTVEEQGAPAETTGKRTLDEAQAQSQDQQAHYDVAGQQATHQEAEDRAKRAKLDA